MGPGWAARRLVYSLKKRSGWLRRRMPCRTWDECGEYCFVNYTAPGFGTDVADQQVVADADRILGGEMCYFSRHWHKVGFPPKWSRDPFTEAVPDISSEAHWSTIPDAAATDIKITWEPGRFGFAFPLAQAYATTKDEKYAEGFWQAVEDWRQANQPQCGPNWMCGQEVAVRMIAWLFSVDRMRNAEATTGERLVMLAHMIGVSAERIRGNISYALSQKNNHGISEATGLFAAGVVLGNNEWLRRGKSLLETQALELICEDGSFSQHSVNYHRVMLDNYRWAFALAASNGVGFREVTKSRVAAANRWLAALTDESTGHASNLGHNDGAHVLPLGTGGYRDYRGALSGTKVRRLAAPCMFGDGGYAVIPHDRGSAIFRCPERFEHRPSQCDLLHVDVWHDGVNVLRDAGTYSYNCEKRWLEYFPSVAAHNTIQFDDHDQMPKPSRFLYGRWPSPDVTNGLDAETPFVEAGFTDWKGCRHNRRLEATADGYRVTDRISGFKEKAVLRWRLEPGLDWQLDGNEVRADRLCVHIEAEEDAAPELSTGYESRYYMEKTELPVLEVELHRSHTVTTEVSFL